MTDPQHDQHRPHPHPGAKTHDTHDIDGLPKPMATDAEIEQLRRRCSLEIKKLLARIDHEKARAESAEKHRDYLQKRCNALHKKLGHGGGSILPGSCRFPWP